MTELYMDLSCEGSCADPDSTELVWYAPSGKGYQVRWNPVAGLSLCAYCQDRWANWYTGTGAKPRWMPGD